MILALENLTHTYTSRRSPPRTALSQLNLHWNSRGLFGVLGPNGGGKSTLFKILSTLLKPTSGSAEILGLDLRTHPADVRRRLGVVFQTNSLDRQLTVEENLISQGHLHALSGPPLTQRIDAALTALQLSDRRHSLVRDLSGGLARRTEIAKALLHEPSVLLLDEPSAGLDPAARRSLLDLLLSLKRARPLTILLTTHLLDEAEHCDRLLLIHEGRRVAEGSPAELKAQLGEASVAEFESPDPEVLANSLNEKFNVTATIALGHVRVEVPAAHRFVAEAVEALPGQITSVAFHQPTLEDVFLKLTGARL